MLLPNLELDVVAEDPEQVRSLISRLSHVRSLGVVEALPIDEGSIIRIHADRYGYTVIAETDTPATVFESIGPKVVRTWQKDPPALVEEAHGTLQQNFDECEEGLQSFRYLYTEASWFVWREHRNTFLPKVKRRAFVTPDGEVAVLHLKQKDVPNGDSLEYFLELEGRIWKYSITVLLTESGNYEPSAFEKAHAVDSVGF